MNMAYAAGLALVVTDRTQVAGDRSLLEVVAGALQGGAHGVIVRDRDLPETERAALVSDLRAVCADHGALLLDRHLRRDDALPSVTGPDLALVGRSCHNLAELRQAAAEGLGYATLSPVASTRSKPGYGPALGAARARDLIATLRAEQPTGPKVIALGGVTADNAGYWIEAGADGVAVMGEVMRAEDPEAAMRSIVESVSAAMALAT